MYRAAAVRACPHLAGILVLAGAAVLPATASASAPSPGGRALRQGAHGADVRALQRELTQTGFRTHASGVFDAQTTRSVKSFERRYRLNVDGVASARFRRALSDIRKLDLAEVDNAIGSGGGGLGAPTTTRATKRRTPTATRTRNRRRTQVTASTSDPSSVAGTLATPVVRDGGSQNLGERVLRKGMNGHDVSELQSFLTLDGFPTGIDGGFGPLTRTSVIKFEKANHMRTNGVVTFPQAMALRQDVSKALTATGASAGATATLNPDGTVTAPAGAPQVVQQAIAAANSIIDTPYIYGGGHGSFQDSGYDCSGAVSFALHGGGLLTTPEDSTELESYGQPGPGKWITVYANAGHAFVVIAGLAFNTAHYGPITPSGTGPRWLVPSEATADVSGGNYVIRHPAGL